MKLDKEKKKKIISLLIIYFVFLTFSFSIYTLSKYAGTVSKRATVEVALWDVELDTTVTPSDDLDIVSGTTTQIYKLKVKSQSEVATTYDVVLKNVPSGVQVKIDGGSYKSASSNKITFSNVGEFDASSANRQREHTLTFKAPLGTSEITDHEIDLEVKFTQKEI